MNRLRFDGVLLYYLAVFSLVFGNNLITGVLLLLSFIVGFKQSEPEVDSRLFGIALASLAFFIFLALSFYWSENKAVFWDKLGTKASFALFPLLTIFRIKVNLLELLKYFIASNLMAMLLALIMAAWRSIKAGSLYFYSDAGEVLGSYFTYGELAQDFMHPGYMALHMAVSILAIFFFWRHFISRYGHFTTYSAFAALWLFVFLLQGRMVLLSLLLVLAIWVLLNLRKLFNSRILYVLLGLMVFGFLVLTLMPDRFLKRYTELPKMQFEFDADLSAFNSATLRLAEWSCAKEVVYENAWFGVGLGDGETALQQKYRDKNFVLGMEYKFNAHNQYLETAISNGLIGVLFLILLLSAFGWVFVKEGFGFSMALLLLFALSFITESIIERAWGVLLFNVLLFPMAVDRMKARVN